MNKTQKKIIWICIFVKILLKISHSDFMKSINLLKESFLFAVNALKVNGLRTMLTLSGITIGIFAIISVFTIFDSLENTIKNSLSALGDDVIYIQKWPWAPPPGEEYKWW